MATARSTSLAPGLHRLDGDGSKLIPSIIADLGPELAARTLVIFDGEKRIEAHRTTYKRVRDRVAAAIFDDSNVGQKPFHRYLDAEGEIWWEANQSHAEFVELQRREDAHYQQGNSNLDGGFEGSFHPRYFRQEFVIVKGGAWT